MNKEVEQLKVVETYFSEQEEEGKTLTKQIQDVKDEIRKKIAEFAVAQKEFTDIDEKINKSEDLHLLQSWWGAESRMLEKKFQLSDLLEKYDKLLAK